jgi:hypothetical protein
VNIKARLDKLEQRIHPAQSDDGPRFLLVLPDNGRYDFGPLPFVHRGPGFEIRITDSSAAK